MADHEQITETASAGGDVRPVKAKKPETDAAADYYERFERRKGDEKHEEENSLDYWLSDEEEEEDHQLKRRKWRSRLPKVPYVVEEAKGPKLRPAEHVLSRLRWDASLDMADFTIGYLERFEGVKEMPVTTWITETTEEDFIPQHRIKYFKRTRDGEIFWHRDGRIDRFFGSGLTGRAGVTDESKPAKVDLPAIPQPAEDEVLIKGNAVMTIANSCND